MPRGGQTRTRRKRRRGRRPPPEPAPPPEGLPVVAIVGRPNVGKSTLFNAWTGRRRAIVSRTPGTTRDRLSAVATAERTSGEEVRFELVDTGGVGIIDEAAIAREVTAQIEAAIAEADVLVFLLDTRAGTLPLDREVASILRRVDTPVVVAANKCETDVLLAEAANFLELGLGEPVPLSAEGRTNLDVLRERVAELVPETAPVDEGDSPARVAVVGRRNAGKSTFVNALAGTSRVVVSDVPGTTRDPVDVRVDVGEEKIVIVDTAGVGRRREGKNAPDFFSIAASRRSVERAEAVILIVDCRERVGRVEKELARLVNDSFRPAVIVVNKWDLAEAAASRRKARGSEGPEPPGAPAARAAAGSPGSSEVGEAPEPSATSVADSLTRDFERYLARRLPGLAWAPIVFASALRGERVTEAAALAAELARSARRTHTTSALNRMLRRALDERRPPSPRGQYPRVYYATQIGTSPPTVAVFVNDTKRFSQMYVKFLENRFREYWDEGEPDRPGEGAPGGSAGTGGPMVGGGEVPVRIILKPRPKS